MAEDVGIAESLGVVGETAGRAAAGEDHVMAPQNVDNRIPTWSGKSTCRNTPQRMESRDMNTSVHPCTPQHDSQ